MALQLYIEIFYIRTKLEQIYYRTNREHQELEHIENKYFPYNRYTMPLNS